MKRATAIFLFLLFGFSQYARQLDYIGCKFSNSFRSDPDKCDCEKQAGLDKKDPNSSSPKTHSHVHFEDLVSIDPALHLTCPFIRDLGISYGIANEDECAGFHSSPQLPPDPGII